uniref:Uncharacterized protein n=1 Tax=Anguilla anguilla TaxID=7936 RepID=A0A0E9X569_ANGAN
MWNGKPKGPFFYCSFHIKQKDECYTAKCTLVSVTIRPAGPFCTSPQRNCTQSCFYIPNYLCVCVFKLNLSIYILFMSVCLCVCEYIHIVFL